MTMTRAGSVVPRWIATMSMTSVGCGRRSPVKVCAGVTICRQPPQSLENVSKRDFTQRRAAPIPRVADFVSDSVLRVPKPTRCAIVACSSSALTRPMISCRSGCSSGWISVAASGAASSTAASRINARTRNLHVGGPEFGPRPLLYGSAAKTFAQRSAPSIAGVPLDRLFPGGKRVSTRHSFSFNPVAGRRVRCCRPIRSPHRPAR